ncbi:MAG TPA: selenium cofactor biosynthesis protein YqeC [Terriglobales bacterium]|nr:selenium cofactor biosynthesis protein YqeC [Terriglobales bacterium]
MPPGPRDIVEVFGVAARRYVHLIGGGGKTTLMFALARALADSGRTVLTTTTTRIREPDPEQSERVITASDTEALITRLKAELAVRRHVTAAASRDAAGRKLGGFDPDQLDRIVEAAIADHVIVEADGSAGLSLKAHREHEPVVSARADLVIAVVGVDVLGAPLDDAHVHRADLARARLGRPAPAPVTAEDVAGIVFHREGYLARVAPGAAVIAFVNKADTPARLAEARRLAAALRAADRARRVDRVVVGDARNALFEIVPR